MTQGRSITHSVGIEILIVCEGADSLDLLGICLVISTIF